MKKILLLILILMNLVPLFSLTLEEGNLKLVVDEQTGGFLLYRRSSRQSPWNALMEESFTGSYFSVTKGGEWINLVLDSRVERRFENDGLSIQCLFDHKDYQLKLSLDLVQYGQTSLQNYLRIRGTLTAKTENTLGLRFLLDTAFLRGNEHFNSNGESIRGEKSWTETLPPFVLNRGNSTMEKIYLFPERGFWSPSRLSAANWTRLDRESGEGYSPKEGRNFDELPFSINDSALAYYWPSVALRSGGSQEFSLMLGVDEPEAISSEIKELTQDELAGLSLRIKLIKNQLDYINEFLDELYYIEESGQSLSENDILQMTKTLEKLKSKKIEYEGIQ